VTGVAIAALGASHRLTEVYIDSPTSGAHGGA
jgi:hypothetical protein